VNCLTPLDPVPFLLTVRTMKNAELFKMLAVSVTWVSVSLLGTHSSGEVSVMSTMIVPAGTLTLDVCVGMGSVSATDCGSVMILEIVLNWKSVGALNVIVKKTFVSCRRKSVLMPTTVSIKVCVHQTVCVAVLMEDVRVSRTLLQGNRLRYRGKGPWIDWSSTINGSYYRVYSCG